MPYVITAFFGLMGDSKVNGTIIEVGPTGARSRLQVSTLDDKTEASLKLLSERSAPRFGL